MLNDILNKIKLKPQRQLTEEELKFLKRRIRPAMQNLIESENLAGMRALTDFRFYGKNELDIFIYYAIQQERKLALLWLLNEKNMSYGFEDREFLL